MKESGYNVSSTLAENYIQIQISIPSEYKQLLFQGHLSHPGEMKNLLVMVVHLQNSNLKSSDIFKVTDLLRVHSRHR